MVTIDDVAWPACCWLGDVLNFLTWEAAAGSWHVCRNGQHIAASTANLSAPHAASERNTLSSDVYSLEGLHFLAACCTLVYEHTQVIEETIVDRCACHSTPE